jgi:hypothetical protein
VLVKTRIEWLENYLGDVGRKRRVFADFSCLLGALQCMLAWCPNCILD